MKQALNRLALYCAAKSMSLYVTGDGFAIGPRGGGGSFAQVIPVAELADRVEALNSAPVATSTEDDGARMHQAAIRTLVAMGYEWNSGNRFWMPPPKSTEAAPAPAAIPDARVLAAPGYDELADVLHRAFHQAAHGKGRERHANGEPFVDQVMQDGARRFGTGSLLFQAFKKSEESQRLPLERAVNELLGAIVYLAGAVIAEERKHAKRDTAANDPAISAQRHA